MPYIIACLIFLLLCLCYIIYDLMSYMDKLAERAKESSNLYIQAGNRHMEHIKKLKEDNQTLLEYVDTADESVARLMDENSSLRIENQTLNSKLTMLITAADIARSFNPETGESNETNIRSDRQEDFERPSVE